MKGEVATGNSKVSWCNVLLRVCMELAMALIAYWILLVDFPYPALYSILHQKFPETFPWAHISIPVFVLGFVVVRMGYYMFSSFFKR
jgi:hypothetical protein